MSTTTARKGTARKGSKTPEERRAEAKALHDRLAEQVAALADSERWEAFLRFARSFHAYSANNVMLILMQYPEASQVAGFRQWQAKGRQVRKGEKGIRILGYSRKKVTTEDEHGNEVDKYLARFPILTVFDIAQTDLMDGHSDPEVAHLLTGDDPLGIFVTMAAHLAEQGWTVTREAIPGAANGYTTSDGSQRIVVDSELAPAQAAKTMLHEAAHAVLHADNERVNYIEHRGLCETEAESVAYVLAGMCGLDTSDYSIGYVAGWAKGDAAMVKSTASNVMRAVAILSPALLGDESEVAA